MVLTWSTFAALLGLFLVPVGLYADVAALTVASTVSQGHYSTNAQSERLADYSQVLYNIRVTEQCTYAESVTQCAGWAANSYTSYLQHLESEFQCGIAQSAGAQAVRAPNIFNKPVPTDPNVKVYPPGTPLNPGGPWPWSPEAGTPMYPGPPDGLDGPPPPVFGPPLQDKHHPAPPAPRRSWEKASFLQSSAAPAAAPPAPLVASKSAGAPPVYTVAAVPAPIAPHIPKSSTAPDGSAYDERRALTVPAYEGVMQNALPHMQARKLFTKGTTRMECYPLISERLQVLTSNWSGLWYREGIALFVLSMLSSAYAATLFSLGKAPAPDETA